MFNSASRHVAKGRLRLESLPLVKRREDDAINGLTRGRLGDWEVCSMEHRTDNASHLVTKAARASCVVFRSMLLSAQR